MILWNVRLDGEPSYTLALHPRWNPRRFQTPKWTHDVYNIPRPPPDSKTPFFTEFSSGPIGGYGDSLGKVFVASFRCISTMLTLIQPFVSYIKRLKRVLAFFARVYIFYPNNVLTLFEFSRTRTTNASPEILDENNDNQDNNNESNNNN